MAFVHLSRFSDLALRALMLLAVADGRDERLTSAGIARDVGASAGHLAKSVSRLADLGLVETRRGRGGGLHITEAGRSASVGRLLRELEGPGEVVDCTGTTPCPLATGCRLRGALARAREAFFVSLDPVLVSDLVAEPTLGTLLTLHITGPPPTELQPASDH